MSETFFIYLAYEIEHVRHCSSKTAHTFYFIFLILAKNKQNYASICKNGALLQFFVKIRLSAKKMKILHNFFLFNSQKQQF